MESTRTDLARTSIWRRRMTRRSILRGAGVAFGGAVVGGSFVGCGGSSKTVEPTSISRPTGPTPTPAPKKGGTLNLAMQVQMTDLHPHVTSSSQSAAVAFAYDHLVYYDYPGGTYAPGVAESVETPDPLTYIFKIRPTARFHNVAPVNGRQVTSEDVALSWAAYAKNPRATNQSIFTQYVDRYDSTNPAIFIVKMKSPNPWAMLNAFSAPHPSVIVPKEMLAQDKYDTLGKVALGSGAYVLDQFDPASTLSFKRRPDAWYIFERPYIDKVSYSVITDDPARAAAFKAKQIDVTAARDKLQADEFRGYGPDVVIDRDLTYPSFLWMNAGDDGFFKDVRLREAVYNALDIKTLIDQVQLGEAEWSGPVAGYLSAFTLPDDDLKRYYPKNLQKAKELLAAAGWDSRQEVDFKYGSDNVTALIAGEIQKQLEAVGIRTKLAPQEWNTVFWPQTLQKTMYQLAAGIQLNKGQDPYTWLRMWTSKGIAGLPNSNYSKWADKEVDDMVDRLAVESDVEKQKSLSFEIQRLLFKKFAPMINVYARYELTAHWGYYHPARGTGNVGVWGHYSWVDKP